MKIDYAIHSSDSNPFYLDFWSVVSEIWKVKFNVTAILVYIDYDDRYIDETYGKVIRIKPIEDIPIYLQTLLIRYWIPILYPDHISIISDIDMLPLSYQYFHKSIESFSNNDYIHLNPCVDTYGKLPSCYHIAKGSSYVEILELDSNWEDFMRKVLSDDRYKNNQEEGSKKFWFVDEIYSSFKVLNYYNQKRIKLLDRPGGQNGFRIDRLNWKYHNTLLRFDYYYDTHSIRPFSKHVDEINKLKELTLNARLENPSKGLVLFFYVLDKIKKTHLIIRSIISRIFRILISPKVKK